jgi:hypothetical protein
MNSGIAIISGLGLIGIGYFLIAAPLLFFMYIGAVSIIFMTIRSK